MSGDAAERLSFKVPAGEARAEMREKGSRFLAIVRAAEDRGSAQAALSEIRERYRDATHHCWAWRLGWPPEERSSDAGEPAGTAGLPILQVLRGARLSQVLAVVVRWFGGTKLGKGGLARAYSEAIAGALAELTVMERVPAVRLLVEMPYDRIGAARRLLQPPQIQLVEEQYGQSARLTLLVYEARRADLEERLAELGLTTEVPDH